MKIKYSNRFLKDLKIHENAIIITAYGVSFDESIAENSLSGIAEGIPGDIWWRSEGLEVIKDSDVLKLYIDFNGINIITNASTPNPGKLDIMEDTLKSKYAAIYFYYKIYESNDEHLAFALIQNFKSRELTLITDLCSTRNIIEISLPPNSTNIFGSLTDPNTDFLEGPGKKIGIGLYGDDEVSKKLISRDGYYKYIRLEDSLEESLGKLSWESSGAKTKSPVITRVYSNLSIDFGNFDEDPKSKILIRSNLPTDKNGAFYLHGSADYTDIDENGNEISKGQIPIELIEELEILPISSSSDFNYAIDNSLKAITWTLNEEDFYVYPYGLFIVHIPSFISLQEELYSQQFKLVFMRSETIWEFHPETEDVDLDNLVVITLEGEKDLERSIYFTTNIPKEYLSEENCLMECPQEITDYFNYRMEFSEITEDNQNKTKVTITFITCKENDSYDWAPKDDNNNPYTVTFKCTFDNYEEKFHLAQYPLSTKLIVYQKDDQNPVNNSFSKCSENTVIIPADTDRVIFLLAVDDENFSTNPRWTRPNNDGYSPTFDILNYSVHMPSKAITGRVYYNSSLEDPISVNDNNFWYFAWSSLIGDQIMNDQTRSFDFTCKRPEEEMSEDIPEWRKNTGSATVKMIVKKKSAGPVFYYDGEGYNISSLSLENYKQNISGSYILPIVTNRPFKATLINSSGLSFSPNTNQTSITINDDLDSPFILYNISVNSTQWGGSLDNTPVAGKITFTSLAEDRTFTPIDVSITRYSVNGYKDYYRYIESDPYFPIKYASSDTDPNSPSLDYPPEYTRFGVIDNIFESPDNPNKKTKIYFVSSTDILSYTADNIKFIQGFTLTSANTNYYEPWGSKDTNQRSIITVRVDKNQLEISDYYFPTTVIGTIEFKNWNPNNPQQAANAIGCLFMKPFNNTFWYQLDDNPLEEALNNNPLTILFEKEASTNAHQLIIYSRYKISENASVVYLRDNFGYDISKTISNDDHTITIQKISTNIDSPSSLNNYCRYTTTYKFSISANTDANDPYRNFGNLEIMPTIKDSSGLGEFVQNANNTFNYIYSNLEKTYHGEHYTTTIASRSWADPDSEDYDSSNGGLMLNFTSGLQINLIQKGMKTGTISVQFSPPLENLSPYNSEGYFTIIPEDEDITISEIENIVCTGGINIDASNKSWISYGIIQGADPTSNDCLWSTDPASSSPSVFDYSLGTSISKRISFNIKYYYTPSDVLTYNYVNNSITQKGYQYAIYFYYANTSFERFGIGRSNGNDSGVLDTSEYITISSSGETINCILGKMKFTSSGPSDTDVYTLNSVSSSTITVNYNPSTTVSRGGSTTNLGLTFPSNLSGRTIYYILKVEDDQSTLYIKFKQETFTSYIKFCNKQGTVINNNTLEILSDGTIYKENGIGNVGGDEYNVLYFKTNIPWETVSNFTFSASGGSIISGYSITDTGITDTGNNIYKISDIKFYPNRSAYTISGGGFIIKSGMDSVITASLTQYCFSIVLKYYSNIEDKTGRSQPQPAIEWVSDNYFTLTDPSPYIPYNICNKQNFRSCFMLEKIVITDPDSSITEMDSGDIIDWATSDSGTGKLTSSSDHVIISGDGTFTNENMEMVIEDTESSLQGKVPYTWFTYDTSNVPENTNCNIFFKITVKYPDENPHINNFKNLTDGKQIFKFSYTASKLNDV